RARWRADLARLDIVSFEMARAWAEVARGYEELGHSAPHGSLPQLGTAFVAWFWAWCGSRVAWLRRRVDPAVVPRLRVPTPLFDATAELSFVEGKVVLMLQTLLRKAAIAYSLGSSLERVSSLVDYAVMMGAVGSTRAAQRYTDAAIALALQLGDPQAA